MVFAFHSHFSYSPVLRFGECSLSRTLNAAALSRRKPASAGATCDTFSAHGQDKIYPSSLCVCQNVLK